MNGSFLVDPEPRTSTDLGPAFDRFASEFRDRWQGMGRTERYRAITGLGLAVAQLAGLDIVNVALSSFRFDRLETVLQDGTSCARAIRMAFDRGECRCCNSCDS